MKYQLKIALSCCSANGQEPLITITVKTKQRKPINKVPVTLLNRIQACSTTSELMTLLFTTPAKDEAVMRAFDSRIEGLEKEEKTNNIHSLKNNNNGSTTYNTTA